ncbi:hypothetical protein CK203_031052 [Vitis vinifera]|uniref:Retrotransposon gag domain-containing protein n=1 Tax=Vitis vinifera TaxID=29760 RepID=A0A438I1B9_VITVI|nr:hypothetical protein CK203_031052 [Vitis vinifera]
MRQMRVSDGSVVWDDFGGMPVASLPAKFRMPDIERYTGIGCPRLHLRLYSTVMRAHGLDEPQMITLFPLSLSGAAQRWFASLESSRRRTWDDLAQECGPAFFTCCCYSFKFPFFTLLHAFKYLTSLHSQAFSDSLKSPYIQIHSQELQH